jgi:hypothetical protein
MIWGRQQQCRDDTLRIKLDQDPVSHPNAWVELSTIEVLYPFHAAIYWLAGLSDVQV